MRDGQFLFVRITIQLQDLHPVSERSRDRVEQVRRRNEHYSRQVERNIEIVVAE